MSTRSRAEAVGTAHGRRTVKSSRRARCRAAARASHMRRDVGRATLAEATVLLAGLGGMLGLLQAEVVHVELVGHDCDVVGWVRCVFVVCGRECRVLLLCKCLCGGTCVVSYKERLQRDTEEWFMRGDVVFREVVRERSVEGSVGRNSRW